jgi:hypothetical protein
MFSCQKQYLTRSLRSLVRYCFCHSNIKSISLRNRLISYIYWIFINITISRILSIWNQVQINTWNGINTRNAIPIQRTGRQTNANAGTSNKSKFNSNAQTVLPDEISKFSCRQVRNVHEFDKKFMNFKF